MPMWMGFEEFEEGDFLVALCEVDALADEDFGGGAVLEEA